MARVSRIEIDLLLALLDEGFDRKAWHGPNLLGSLRGLSAEQALRRPAPGRHNVWEIAVHCAYWKSIVRRRLDPDSEEERFPRGPRDWPALPDPADEAAWRADLKLLKTEHRRLRRRDAPGLPRLLS